MTERESHSAIGDRDSASYANDTMHKTLGITFAPVSARKVKEVQDMIDTIALGIGEVIPPEVIAPSRGVLANPMNPQTRKIIGAHLDAQYAKRTMEEQKITGSIAIAERGDKMLSLKSACEDLDAHIYITPRVFESSCGIYASKERIHYLRARVATKVATVFKALNEVNLRGHVYDCYRPEAVQATLFLRRLVGIAQQETHWENKEVSQSAQSLTAWSPGMAGHQAGAAIDWRLSAKGSHWKPDLGNEYTEGGAVSSIDFPYVTYDQWKTRTLFAATMIMSGMRLLRTEDWHASFGDRGMGLDGGTHEAIYGPVRKFNAKSKEIEEYYPEEMIDTPYFSYEEMDQIIEIARMPGTSKETAIQSAIRYLLHTRDPSGSERVRSWMQNI